MKGKATITTTTTVTPVFVTEVKNGQVMKNLGAETVIVRTEDGIKMFSQSEIDRRGIRVYRDGKPVMLSDLREGNKLAATFVTERPPQVMTEKEVEATITQAAASGAPPAAPAAQGTTPTTSAEPAAAPAAPGAPAAAPTTMAAPAAGPAAAPAATTAPVSAAPAEAGGSWLRWGALIILLVIVAVVLFRRSGN
jgi:hypothetical protein